MAATRNACETRKIRSIITVISSLFLLYNIYLRIGFPWQNGCTFPPFIHKSNLPLNDSWPSVPAFVCMICTNSASSRVKRNVFGALNSISGLAGSRPAIKTDYKSEWNISGIYRAVDLSDKRHDVVHPPIELVPIMRCCRRVRCVVTMPQMCAPNECPTQVICVFLWPSCVRSA